MAVVRSQQSIPTPPCCYDVFLSFRGEDLRKTFIDHLYTALVQVGIHTFRDDDEIRRGENIKSELQNAIEQSRISIFVFSKTYAESTWCLDELLEILHCKNTSGQQVLPVFYDVDPSQVRKQKGSFEAAFSRHEMQCDAGTDERKSELMKKVESWRTALTEVSNLGGMVLQNECDGHEAKFVQKIVQVMKDKLDRGVLSNDPFLIGIEHPVKKLNLWLKDGMDAGIFVICGIGGIGKTTIAKEVYNSNKKDFDGSSFLANVNERSKTPNGLVEVQKQLLSDFGKEQRVTCVDDGITKIKDVVRRKRVLLILDDVDQVDQLDAVFRMREWLGTRSKVIITTRNRSFVNAHGVHRVQEVKHLNNEDSLQLLSWHAFGQQHHPEEYAVISQRVVDHCGGLPLALKVLGSSLVGKSLSVWKSALDKLEVIPDERISKKLAISYYSLSDDHDKELFLHIACFFIGWDKDWTPKILDECDFYTTIGIQNLVDRCLITIDTCGKITMHQLIRDMGRQIVHQESPKQPGKQSRLWHHKDSLQVLSEKTGTDTIKGLILDANELKEDKFGTAGYIVTNKKKRAYEEILQKSFFADLGNSLKRTRLGRFYRHPVETSLRNSSNIMSLDADAFVNMNNLKLLKLNYIQIIGCLKKFPKSLRWLCLDGFPSEFLPSDFPLENVGVLQIRHSSLKQIWKQSTFLTRLKILDLSNSQALTKTSDFSGLTRLETLILEDCVSLVEVHISIGNLEGLILLNLRNCKNLKKLPRTIGMLKSLETLILEDCLSLVEVHISIGNLEGLILLNLRNCKNLKKLPRTIGMLKSPEIFIINGCSNLAWLPNELETMSSLKVLRANGVDMTKVFSTTEEVQPWHAIMRPGFLKPQRSSGIPAISLPHSLTFLSLVGCNLSDEVFPQGLSNLPLLSYLDLSENPIRSLPESIKSLTRLNELHVNSCRRLKSISLRRDLIGVDHIPCEDTLLSISFALFCKSCCNLVEIEGYLKLEPVKDVDIHFLRRWGFVNLNTAGHVMVNYHYHWCDYHVYCQKLPLQRLWQNGVYNYFLPGDTIPEEFSIRGTGSCLSFVLPSLFNYNIRDLVVCCLYTTSTQEFEGFNFATIVLTFRRRGVADHCNPVYFGIPNPNENMVWVSQWKVGDKLREGDQMELEVNPYSSNYEFYPEVKEVGIQFVYEHEEENGTPSMLEDPFFQSSVSKLRLFIGWQNLFGIKMNMRLSSKNLEIFFFFLLL